MFGNVTLPNWKNQTNKSIPPHDSCHQRVQKQQLHPWVSHPILWISIWQIIIGWLFSTNVRVCASMTLPYLWQNVCQEPKPEVFGRWKLNLFLEGTGHLYPGIWTRSKPISSIFINYLFLWLETPQRELLTGKKGALYIRQCVRCRSL